LPVRSDFKRIAIRRIEREGNACRDARQESEVRSASGDEFIELVLSFCELRFVFRLRLLVLDIADDRHVLRLVARGEDTIHRIVILLQDGIELVIVTARACDSEPIVPRVRVSIRSSMISWNITEEPPANGQESQGGKVRIIRAHEMIRRDLHLQETIRTAGRH
jgi:hypothetical protein